MAWGGPELSVYLWYSALYVPSIDSRERRVSWRRLLAGGLLLTALAGAAGGALELWWFGRTDASAARRVERDVNQRFGAMVRAITQASAQVATDPRAAAGLNAGPDAGRQLFDVVLEARRSTARPAEIAITIYDKAIVARAWAGAPSDIPNERIAGPSTLFVTPSPLGLRLVHVQPITSSESSRLGAVATEHVLSPAPAATTLTPTDFTLQTGLGPASLRTEGAGDLSRQGAVLLSTPSGEPLAEAWVDPRTLRAARADWRRHVGAVMLALVGCTALLLVGPLLDRRIRGQRRTYVGSTLGALGLTALGGMFVWVAVGLAANARPSTPVSLLVGGATAAALVSLLAGPVARLRVAMRGRALFLDGAPLKLFSTQILAGAGVAALIVLFYLLLGRVIDPVSIDLRHFSLHPWSVPRITLLTGIVAAHLAVLWGGTLLLTAAAAPRRIPRSAIGLRLSVLALWIAPAVAAAAILAAPRLPIPRLGLVLSAAACAIAALNGTRISSWYRRTTVAARIFALFLAFLIPALLLYPSMNWFAERATRGLIATEYAVQAQNHVQTLLQRTEQARKEVDALDALPDLIANDSSPDAPPDFRAAFLVWQQTVLARERLTSAVELYDRTGKLVSRFPLNLPEYSATSLQSGVGCDWDVFGEVAPFGAEERRMLHAERRICTTDANGQKTIQGAIILHVLFEYETLPFMTSQNPYFEVVRAADTSAKEGTAGGNVEVAIYGWGLQPVYTSGRSAWPITDELFARLYASRQPFWAEVDAGGSRHQVFFSNDRERIFAIGYPVLTVFDHFVHLAELTTFGGAVFGIVLIGTGLFTRIGRQRPRVGRALLREIRASFYRKLFLAFVLAAIIPVLTLALVIRTYFANLLQADVEAEAARTAAVAQRVIQDVDIGLRRSAQPTETLSDDWMVWISQVINQDVNVFRGAELVATSERALFASGVLPTRTPDDVYRAIVLQRLPSFVREDAIGAFSYMLAAAPVRAAGQDVLLTVPLTLRQREIEREIDELDRGVHLAALFFILLGAAIGLSMAERIADPVRRLTRATGKIARGDFDARIAVRSTDELRRLVDAFNSMAAELKAQRVQLERTHRLEAWAEMARQVAHEIKNPLTPIQLSAEHLQRVHADRGEPLGPILENCVTSILGQVRLLRQIASEFSSFASSPTARRASVSLPELVAEVVDPYRTGLKGRIEIVNRVPPSLPPVLVDRTLTLRALSNVVENALHAMPGNGTLTIDAVVDPSEVSLVVTDTGVGMDEEALERVFEPYFSTKTTGTGLGLPIARRNIELNGGSIDVRSVKGEGTTVTVRLPQVDAATPPTDVQLTTRLRADATARQASER
jgi:signal transduction histidine kinase